MGYSRMILGLNMGVTKLRSRSNFRREKVHRDLHLDLDRFFVEDVGAIAPLDDGIDGCANRHGMASKDPQVFDRALPADHGLQHYRSLNACASRERRVLGLYFGDEIPLPPTR